MLRLISSPTISITANLERCALSDRDASFMKHTMELMRNCHVINEFVLILGLCQNFRLDLDRVSNSKLSKIKGTIPIFCEGLIERNSK